MGLQELWKYFHKVEGNVCTQWTVPHPARPDNQFKQVSTPWPVPPLPSLWPAGGEAPCNTPAGDGLPDQCRRLDGWTRAEEQRSLVERPPPRFAPRSSTDRPPPCPQFMNQDFVGQTPGRCSDAGYGKNELKFSAYVAQSNPFTPTKDAGAVVNLG